MGTHRPFVQRLKAAWKAWNNPGDARQQVDLNNIESYMGSMIRDDSGRIRDGADYSQPVSLPGHLRESLRQSGELGAYLQENMRDTYRFQFDTPQRGRADTPVTPTTEDPLKEWDPATRKMVLSNCHSVYERNPVANTALQYTADFVIGEGFNLTARNKRVLRFLNEFIDSPDNAIREFERQAVIDLQLDGELFIRYFEGDTQTTRGQVVAVPLRPWECLGIKTELGFFRRPEIYRFQFEQTEGDAPDSERETEEVPIPAAEIQHVAINRHSYELRGRPELYRVLPWLRADKEFLENVARQNHWRNALLWFVKVANALPGQVAAVLARWAKPPTPGTVAVEGANVDVQPLVNSASSSAATEDGRQIKNRSIMGLRLPEYFFADGYNANLATSKSQQLPAMTKFGAFQTIMIEQVWIPMFRRVLQVAVDAGLLPPLVEEQDAEGQVILVQPEEFADYEEEGLLGPAREDGSRPKMCETICAFEVAYSPLGDADKLTLAQAITLLLRLSVIDMQTAREDLGYDPAIIEKRLKRQEEAEADDVAAGLKPPPPQMRPSALPDDMQPEEASDAPQPEAVIA